MGGLTSMPKDFGCQCRPHMLSLFNFAGALVEMRLPLNRLVFSDVLARKLDYQWRDDQRLRRRDVRRGSASPQSLKVSGAMPLVRTFGPKQGRARTEGEAQS